MVNLYTPFITIQIRSLSTVTELATEIATESHLTSLNVTQCIGTSPTLSSYPSIRSSQLFSWFSKF